MTSPRLTAGDVILFDGRQCRVVRVNDCAAVISVPMPARTIRPRFDAAVTIQPAPRLLRISANAETPILAHGDATPNPPRGPQSCHYLAWIGKAVRFRETGQRALMRFAAKQALAFRRSRT